MGCASGAAKITSYLYALETAAALEAEVEAEIDREVDWTVIAVELEGI